MIILLTGQLLHSTSDIGKEFFKHGEVSKFLSDVQFYCSLPSHPWDRETNENTNGLLREYFPKYEYMSVHANEYIESKIREINLRPRKCLGWKTPYEVYFDNLLHLI